jgi:hypothetical protein
MVIYSIMKQEHFDMLDRIEDEIFAIPDGNDKRKEEYIICEELWKLGLLTKFAHPVNFYGVMGVLFSKPFPLDTAFN